MNGHGYEPDDLSDDRMLDCLFAFVRLTTGRVYKKSLFVWYEIPLTKC